MTTSETSELVAAKWLCAFGLLSGTIASDVRINSGKPSDATVMLVNDIIRASKCALLKLVGVPDDVLGCLLHEGVIVTP
jgi:hypothetical protein